MEDTKNNLLVLANRLQHIKEKENLDTAVQTHKNRVATHLEIQEGLRQAQEMVRRKNTQIEAELKRQALIQNKNNNLYAKRNSERLRLSKLIIGYEQKNESLESLLEDTERRIKDLEAELVAYRSPSPDSLYLEIIKGFNVDFVKRDEGLVARVMNCKKNDLFYVNVDTTNMEDACESIWGAMCEK